MPRATGRITSAWLSSRGSAERRAGGEGAYDPAIAPGFSAVPPAPRSVAPDPWAWTDRDLAIGLSRTYRWAGYSAWDLPLSVAQHSLTVLALCRAAPGPRLTDAEALRELLHDAVEALLGGWDPITPLKPDLGDGFARLVARLQAAIEARYTLPPWTAGSHARHKHADRLAAARRPATSPAGAARRCASIWASPSSPPRHDPLPLPNGLRPWEPWPPRKLAEQRFLDALQAAATAAERNDAARPTSNSPGKTARSHPETA